MISVGSIGPRRRLAIGPHIFGPKLTAAEGDATYIDHPEHLEVDRRLHGGARQRHEHAVDRVDAAEELGVAGREEDPLEHGGERVHRERDGHVRRGREQGLRHRARRGEEMREAHGERQRGDRVEAAENERDAGHGLDERAARRAEGDDALRLGAVLRAVVGHGPREEVHDRLRDRLAHRAEEREDRVEDLVRRDRDCADAARGRGHRDGDARAAEKGQRRAHALFEVLLEPAHPERERALVDDAPRAPGVLRVREHAEADDLGADGGPRGSRGAHAALDDEEVVAEEIDDARDGDGDQRELHVAPRQERRLQLGGHEARDEADRADLGVGHGAGQQGGRGGGHGGAAEERAHERHARRAEKHRRHAHAADERADEGVVGVAVARLLVATRHGVGDEAGRHDREEREHVAARVAHGGRGPERGELQHGRDLAHGRRVDERQEGVGQPDREEGEGHGL
mmetsp:Transcript_20583/g.43247  ORF Transcript_20583/g.43247 Transcript_20583/m.43247 type:complete len:457 (+) Transcript_20583:266-1636(+)